MSKKYTTNFLEDTNGSTGTTNQVLVSTATGVDWVDGSGSGIIGGPYLPLSGGSGYPLTGDLYITKAATPLIQLTDTTNSKTLLLGVDDANAFIRTGAGENFYLQVNGGTNAITILNDSNVGIGTTSPSVPLAVEGVASMGSNSRLSMGILDINSGGTPTQILIQTTIPWNSGSADFTVNIKGFVYGTDESCDLSIHWHYYTSVPYNANCTSSGSWAPIINLHSSSSGFVQIHLSSPGYWPKLYVESMYSSAYNDLYASGWSWSDAAGTGTAYPLDYNKDFGNNFVMTDPGDVGIGTSTPGDILHVSKAGTATRLRVGNNGAWDASIYFNTSTDWSIGTDTSNSNSLTFGNSSAIGTGTKMVIETNGNVGIGTDSPTRILELKQGEPYLRFNPTTNAAPYIIGAGDGKLYIVPEATFVPTMTFSSGNVGIGTVSPDSKLHISGSSTQLLVQGNNYSGIHQAQAWSTNTYFGAKFDGTNEVYGATGRGAFKILALHDADNDPQYLAFYGANQGTAGNTITWNTVGFAQDEDGDVGIGTTSPGAQLHLLQPTLFNTTDLFRIQHNEQVWGSTVTVTDFVVKSTGNVGIGTTSPGYKLTVNGTLRSSNLTIADNIIHEGDTNTYMSFPSNDTISWNTNGSERMRINSSGNVGIGTTSPGYRLHVAGSMGMDTYLFHAGNNDTFIGFAATDEFSVNAGGVKQLNVTSNNVNITDTLSYTYPTATNQYNGEIVTFGSFNTANGAIAAGDVIVYTTAGVNSGWMRAQGNITYSKGMLGIAMGTSASDGILIKGFARNAAFASGGLGSPLYLSPTSAGDTTNVIPSSTNNVVRIVGYMLNPTNDEIFFDPDKSWVAV
jgi:hypothetical protein